MGTSRHLKHIPMLFVTYGLEGTFTGNGEEHWPDNDVLIRFGGVLPYYGKGFLSSPWCC